MGESYGGREMEKERERGREREIKEQITIKGKWMTVEEDKHKYSPLSLSETLSLQSIHLRQRISYHSSVRIRQSLASLSNVCAFTCQRRKSQSIRYQI